MFEIVYTWIQFFNQKKITNSIYTDDLTSGQNLHKLFAKQ